MGGSSIIGLSSYLKCLSYVDGHASMNPVEEKVNNPMAWKKKAYNVEKLRQLAKKELPQPIFDFADGAAEDERTRSRNESAFDNYWLVPKPMNGAAVRDLSIDLFGHRHSMPLMIGPTGLSGLFWPDGERATARAAAAAGIGFCLSHGSVCTLEALAETKTHPRWMQIFLYRDRAFTEELVHRAEAAQYDGIVLTVDNQILGKRERDLANGFTIPPEFSVSQYAAMFGKFSWWWRMRNELRQITFGNYVRPGKKEDIKRLAARMAELLDPGLTWKDVEWIRGMTSLPLIIKGILSPDEAEDAIRFGANAVVVSNHGGRQLDGAISSLEALPEIVRQVGGRVPVLLDGGVRRGTDVVIALALGVTGCLLGRPQLWGVSLAGEAGVRHLLDIYYKEIDTAMGLCGASRISDITEELLANRSSNL